MFLITNYNKILLSQGDTASFTVSIIDLDDKEYVPSEEDELQFLVYDSLGTYIHLTGVLNDGAFTVSISGSDTENLSVGFYTYEVRLMSDGDQYTVVMPSIFELVGEEPKEVLQ